MHLQSLGFPVANDSNYGGELYNDIEEIKHDPQTEELGVFKPFPEIYHDICIKFWLHAHEYKYKDLHIVSDLPDWAQKDYVINHKF